MNIIADENIPFVKECFSSIGDVQTMNGRAISASTVKDADILLVRSITTVDEKLLAGSRIKFVGTATIGFEHIDTDYLSKNNIAFASAPGSNADSVAEYVVAALLELAQKYKFRLEDSSIGIIGVGNVGSRVAKKCAALGMKVLLNDPPLQRYKSHREHIKMNNLATENTEGTERERFEEALSRIEQFVGSYELLSIEQLFDCDIITIHTPLTFEGIDRTYHLADENFFNSLKNGSVFINTARGGVVDSSALKTAIKTGRLKTAALDVWENEPNIDIELLEMVDIGTPHIAGYSLEGKTAGTIMIYEAVCKYFGLPAEKKMEGFLPKAQVEEIKIENGIDSEQEVLRRAVKKVYDIKKDDADLRRILDMSKNKSGFLFDRLRKSYHIRREFHNTTCLLATPLRPAGYAGQAEKAEVLLATENTRLRQDFGGQAESTENRLLKKLKGIGFKVSESTKR